MLARLAKRYVLVACSLLIASASLRAQDGEYLFKTYCAICHEATGEERAPGRDVLKQMTPEHILQVLEKGGMKTQAAERSRVQRRILAEYLSGKRFGTEPVDLIPRSAFCSSSTSPFPNTITGPAWNGWGVTITNTRFQPGDAAELSAVDVPRLKLRWAFGFPGASSGGTQPVVVDGRVYVGTAEGDVYALDAKSGCVYWRFESEAAVRSAISVGKAPNGRLAGYFGDQSANMYAVDLETGKLLWKKKVDEYWRSAITGAPTLYAGRLYVPVSSREESQVGDPRYPCCKFRGSVVAMDASNGNVLWKTYMIPEEARPTVKNSVGTQLWGPSGGAVWNAPTIDLKRSALYIGTGNNYSTPATNASDAIVSLDLKSGKIRWVHQVKENDVWNASCGRPDREPAVCPDADAPDVDFAASPSLVDLKNGRQIIIAGNKSGTVFALDPDAQGKTVWQQHVGGNGSGGIMWGPAVDGDRVYAATSAFNRSNPDASGGIAALDLSSGNTMWTTAPPPCGQRTPCKPAQSAAVTEIPGVVFSGTMDGQLRAYSTANGKIIWEYDTAHDYQTVNGVKANGGSMSNAGPTVAGGIVFTNSGYSHHGGVIPGNVLLAFSAE